ncbi:MAG TPA: biopolymer transporter ExbD [Pseudobdellovibrionaceae bacterium]|nr:biopolymer transporter ExbD [Pseudobdellovibrionaceae bacterium]
MAGGGGTEPNLTPFIDLFSVLVCFLLMTAAWLNLETFPVQIEKSAPSTNASESPPPPPDENKNEKKVSLSLSLMLDRVEAKEGENKTLIPHLTGGEFDKDKIQKMLAQWRTQFPDKKDLVLNTEAQVTYGQMIQLYDFLISMDWPDVGINPN